MEIARWGGFPEKWFVYIIQCWDESLYTGISKDVVQRVLKHSRGEGAKYTRPISRRPVRLVYCRALGTRSAALIEEHRIKKLGRQAKLSLARGGVDGSQG